jgi:catechol O-methyltransferase
VITIGDEKGELLDAAVKRADPSLALELGTYVGYGALRIAAAAPSAKVCSVEFAEANAEVARGVWAHAGVDDRITCVVGSIVVADNVRLPGAPKYRQYMRRLQGTHWNTVEHKTHAEDQTLLPDLVLESEYLG